MLLLTRRGTPTIYYGDEIGLSDVSIPYDQVQDPRELRQPGLALGRDPVRTPLPWNARPFAGFSSGSPVLTLNSAWPEPNVAPQMGDARSLLALHRRMLVLQRHNIGSGVVREARTEENN